jgi:hypothetical protein
VAGCCECGDEPSGSCATELVSYIILLPTTNLIVFAGISVLSAMNLVVSVSVYSQP